MQNAPLHKYLYEVSVVPYRPAIMKTTTFSIKDLRKNTFTICNITQVKLRSPTNIGKSFYKRSTLTGVLRSRCSITNPYRKDNMIILSQFLIKEERKGDVIKD